MAEAGFRRDIPQGPDVSPGYEEEYQEVTPQQEEVTPRQQKVTPRQEPEQQPLEYEEKFTRHQQGHEAYEQRDQAENLMNWSPQEVREALSREDISPQEAKNYITRKELKEEDLFNMSPESVQEAYDQGRITKRHVQEYLNQTEDSGGAILGEIGRVAFGGVVSAATNTGKAAHDIRRWSPMGLGERALAKFTDFETPLEKTGDELMEESQKIIQESIPETYDILEDATMPRTTAGEIAKPFVQFLVPYAGLGKVSRAPWVADRVMRSGTVQKLPSKSTRKFAARTSEAAVRGGLLDYAVFDPYQHGLVDMLDEHTDLQNPVIDFLKTDPKNPAILERLKLPLEGVTMGVAFDTLFHGLRAAKHSIWHRNHGKKHKVANEVDKELTGKLRNVDEEGFEFERIPAHAMDEPGGTKAPGGRADQPMPGPENIATSQRETYARVMSPLSEVEESELIDTSTRIIRSVHEGTAPDIDGDKLIQMMERDHGATDIIRAIRSERNKEIKQTRKLGERPLDKVDKDAARQFARLTSGTTEDVMQSARRLFGRAEGLDQDIQAMNKLLTTYQDSLHRWINDTKYTASETDKLRQIQHMRNVQELTSIVYGVRSEMSRALNQYRLPWVKHHGKFDLDGLDRHTLEDLHQSGNMDNVENILDRFRQATDAETRNLVARSAGDYGFLRGTLELMQANLLWQPATHMANVTGTSLAQVNEGLKRYMSLRTEALRRGIAGDSAGAARVMTEWWAYKEGFKKGIKDAFRLPGKSKRHFADGESFLKRTKRAWDGDAEAGKFYRALFTAEPQLDPFTKTEGQEAMSPFLRGMAKMDEYLFDPTINRLFPKDKFPGLGVSIGKFLRIPFHGLSGMDEAMKHTSYFSELHSKVARDAIERGLMGQDFDAAYRAMITNPDKRLHKQALARARETTFTEYMPGKLQQVDNILTNTRAGLIGKISAIPFFRVVLNLTRYAMRNSPMGVLSRKNLDMIKAGGRDRYEAVAGMVQGTALMGGALALYEDGQITGRIPTDLRDAYRNLNIPEYSIKIGDRWVPYKRVDPFAYHIGFAADLGRLWDTAWAYGLADDKEVSEKFDEIGSAFLLTMTEPVLNKTMMKGMQDLMNTVMDPDRHDWATHMYQTQLDKLVPATTLNQLIQSETDELQREIRSFEDFIQARINRRKVNPRRHPVYGTKIPEERSWPFPFTGFVNARTQHDDPVLEELLRVGANVEPPRETLTRDGVEVELEGDEVDRYMELISQLPVQETLQEGIESREYRENLSDPSRADLLRGIINDYREVARQHLWAEETEIQERWKENVRRRAKAKLGLEPEREPGQEIIHFMPDTVEKILGMEEAEVPPRKRQERQQTIEKLFDMD